MAKDLYEVLGISKAATDADIKSAYRKLAMKYHPDKHKGDKDSEQKFKEINVAYEILSDKKKRQQYDTFGATGAGQGGFGGGGGGGRGGFEGMDFSGFGDSMGGFADIFETFFGGGARSSSRKKSASVRGNDIETTIKISFEDAVFGCQKELEITKPDVCKHCGGQGAEPGSPVVTCKTCGGTGEIRTIKHTILGQMTASHVCNECRGEGKKPEKLCSVCNGATRERVKERIKVKIPAGVDNGSTIRLSGKGEGGVKNGPSGDLYINLRVEPSKKFVRYGYDIHSEISIHLIQAVLGDEVSVDTIYGPQTIKIPPGTEDGKVFKLTGKGVMKDVNYVGNHLVKIKIIIPKKLSKKEKDLYVELAKEAGIDVKKSGGLFW